MLYLIVSHPSTTIHSTNRNHNCSVTLWHRQLSQSKCEMKKVRERFRSYNLFAHLESLSFLITITAAINWRICNNQSHKTDLMQIYFRTRAILLRRINHFCDLPLSHKPQMQGNQMGVWGVVLALGELVLFCFRAIGVRVCLQKSAAYSFANIGQHE
jgi:hypothetical protein